jgi:hypothetical protein
LLWIPIVFFFYPETADRSLESIDAMFTTKSPLYIKMEAAYKANGNGDVLAARGQSVSRVEDKEDKVADADIDSTTHSETV